MQYTERMLTELYEYRDYRQFLRDFYERAKAKRGFSYRAFSRLAGLSSPNYLKLVIDGERNLSHPMAERFATACALDEEQSRFFTKLVEHNQAKDSETKLEAEQKLYEFSRFRKVHRMRSELTEYCTNWYIPVVRELASRKDFEHNPKWVARQIRPRISVSQARKALGTLERLGMLTQDDCGRWVQANPLVSSEHEVPLPAVAAFHRTMMDMASKSIDLVDRHERDISSVTLCVPRNQIPKMKARIQEFRREMLKMSEQEGDPEQVVQLNIQLFPLSKASGAPSAALQGDQDE